MKGIRNGRKRKGPSLRNHGAKRLTGAVRPVTPPEEPAEQTPPLDLSEPLDADQPFLDQLEQRVLDAPTDEEFAQGFEWLDRHFYRKPKVKSALSATPFSGRISSSRSTLH